MISKIKVKNFKCFENIEFELGKVNLLAGSNGCGKSSFIQVLLLLRQSVERNKELKSLELYGKYINLGLAKEVIYEEAKNNELQIEIWNDENKHIGIYPQYDAEKYILETKIECEGELSDFNIFSSTFEYVSADRIIPQNIFSAISFEDKLGNRGENTLSFLEEKGLLIQVPKELCMPETEQNYLLYQVNEWLSKLFDGFRLNITKLTEADSVSLRYQEKGDNYMSGYRRAINVGFGITYVLPILVALLKVQKGDMIIIENPEAHLHPKAQRIMGELILRAASAGAQIVLETHSDHILNGIRLGIKNGIINNPEKVKNFFFTRENIGIGYHVNVYAPKIDKEGNIDFWPNGFFDEWDKALMDLF